MKPFMCLLGMLCLSSALLAQRNPLSVGDTLPNIDLPTVLHHQGKSLPTTSLKGKLVLLDFWATWCSPCIAMIPKHQELEKQFEGQLQVLSVTSQSRKEVEAFRAKYEAKYKRRIEGPEVVEDTLLHALFPHNSLPHYVWIDASGVVRAFTEPREVTAETIQTYLQSRQLSVRQQEYVAPLAFDRQLPFLVNNNGGKGENLIYHSVLTSHTSGLPYGSILKRDSTGMKYLGTNQSLSWLYKTAYSVRPQVFTELNTRFEVKDPSCLTTDLVGQDFIDWQKAGNGYCYELLVPKSMQKDFYPIMQQELARLFPQYKAGVEQRLLDCFVMRRTSDQNKLPAATGGKPVIQHDTFGYRLRNASFAQLFYQINYTQRSPALLIDETGLRQKTDLDLPATVSDLKALNQALVPYDLEITAEQRTLPFLIIRDR
ncbi:TlpA family protein disulfide reductase [Siphonobacter curvatus]|uniref:Thioredoxin domain-containing protein n=1 Tax=Siphonobacter curvatus TaxID=2094562 RepID=A0A2S7IF02_9BACT|nr:TlpA disulfide reductase family protein [Siphonobacter curvatus]PQA53226.1 hypothetical protein C5O19_25185 [Siphonobacter curvatus]